MATFWHRLGVYFGLAEQTPEKKAAAEQRAPVSLVRRVVGTLAGLAAGGLVIGLIDQSVWAGVRFALAVGTVFAVLDVYQSFQRNK